MFKLDIAVFNAIYDFCKTTGETFGFSVLEGFYINGILIVGTVLIGLNNKGSSKK